MNVLNWDDETETKPKPTPKKKSKAKKPKSKKEVVTTKADDEPVSRKPLKSYVLGSNIYWVGSLEQFKDVNTDEYRHNQTLLIEMSGVKELVHWTKTIKLKGDTLAILSIEVIEDSLNTSPLEALNWTMENGFMFMRMIKFDIKDWDDKLTIGDMEFKKVFE